MKNNKLVLSVSVFLLSSLLSAGCMGSMGGGSNSSGNESMDMGDGNMDGMDMNNKNSKSYVIAKRYCAQCHEMKSKDLHSTKQWKPTLKRMMDYIDKQAKLKPNAYEKIMIEHYYGID